ncbi:oxidoreductase [Amycolatopsis coloradensis]|uniref:Oxidoreductase n=1 Tax=Amycolatopsis coloradensis TaxID=76021 RepID=A0A1R0L452_9PSEU|nr:oxidoreductase [Amycolatopsis coloradensis]
MIVVGAGVAGLVTAMRLRESGYHVAVLEGRDRVGGRTVDREIPNSGGQAIEMGGQWIGPTQHRALGLIAELGLELYPTYDSGEHIADFNGRLRRYEGRIPWLGACTLINIGLAQLKLDRAAKKVVTDAPWKSRNAGMYDRQTFADWIARNVKTKSGREFFRIVTETVFCAEPEDMSALWAIFYLGSAGGLDALITTREGAQHARVVGGAQLISIRLAERLGDAVTLNAAVAAIDWSGERVVVTTRDGRRFTAGRVVLTVPPALAGSIAMTPPMPPARNALIASMPMGSVLKVNVIYETPFWRETGLSGQANSDVRALSSVYDNTPHTGSPAVLLGLLEGKHAKATAAMSADTRRQLVFDDLAGYFGPKAYDAVDYLEMDWCAEEFSGGCYGGFAQPEMLTRYGTALREPVGPIHFAGTETATRWAGYIDGAAESGEKVAAELKAILNAA